MASAAAEAGMDHGEAVGHDTFRVERATGTDLAAEDMWQPCRVVAEDTGDREGAGEGVFILAEAVVS